MRYNGKGNPLAVLVSCVTLGFLPQILLLLGIIWIVTSIPIWLWVVMGVVAAIAFISKMFKEMKDDKK